MKRIRHCIVCGNIMVGKLAGYRLAHWPCWRSLTPEDQAAIKEGPHGERKRVFAMLARRQKANSARSEARTALWAD